MNQDLSIVSLLLHASFVVQLVVLLLVVISVASWAAIFRKFGSLKRVNQLNDEFEREFWSGTSLNELYAAAAQNGKNAGPMEHIFASGMREYQKLRERHISDPNTLLDGARRAMRASYQREMDNAESGLSLLASAGSVSPYVGLFGTVWGIMHAFTGLAGLVFGDLGDLGNAGRHGGQRDLLQRAQAGEGVHDAPHGAEQPDVR